MRLRPFPLLATVWITAAVAPAWAHGAEPVTADSSTLGSPASRWSRNTDLRGLAGQGPAPTSPFERLPPPSQAWSLPATATACAAAMLASVSRPADGSPAPKCQPVGEDSRANSGAHESGAGQRQ